MNTGIAILPAFLSGLPCPYQCTYCDSRNTNTSNLSSVKEICSEVAGMICRIPAGACFQIAFYGTDFFSIPDSVRDEVFDWIRRNFTARQFNGVRISTRPDTIIAHGNDLDGMIKVVELGAPSLDREVLVRCRRGHSPKVLRQAVYLLRDRKIKVGLQTMIGLPGADTGESMRTASAISRLRPDFVRIHPTLVLRESLLYDEYNDGRYRPMDLETAIETSSRLVVFYRSCGIDVARIGFHIPETQKAQVAAGPYHPAFGSLVKSRIWLRYLDEIMRDHAGINSIRVPPEELSNVLGYQKENIRKLQARYERKILVFS